MFITYTNLQSNHQMTMITSQDILKLPMKQYFQPKQMTWLWANMTRKEIKNADEGVQNAFKNGKNSTKTLP